MAVNPIKVVAVIKRNGVPVGEVNLKRLNPASIKMAILLALTQEMNEMFSFYTDTMRQTLKMRHRPLKGKYSQEIPLMKAYQTAIDASTILKSANGISIKLFKSSEIDRLMSETRGPGGGSGMWWRAHEYGTPSGRVLGSKDHVFAPLVLFERLNPNMSTNEVRQKFGGRHGQGIMVEKDSAIGRLVKSPFHPGSKPFRLISSMKMNIRDRYQVGFKDKVMMRAINLLRGA